MRLEEARRLANSSSSPVPRAFPSRGFFQAGVGGKQGSEHMADYAGCICNAEKVSEARAEPRWTSCGALDDIWAPVFETDLKYLEGGTARLHFLR